MRRLLWQTGALWQPLRQQAVHQAPQERCSINSSGAAVRRWCSDAVAKPKPRAPQPAARQEVDYNDLGNRHAIPPGDWRFYGIAGAALAGVAAVYFGRGSGSDPAQTASEDDAGTAHHFINWSGTHEVRPKRFYEPETEQEVEDIVRESHERGQRLRVVGSALSPNGLAFSEEGMLSMALMDSILHVDQRTRQVTVQAGARVQQIVEGLRPHGLTLHNYASIREQAIGGFVQVGAHGTGARIPPVDEQVVSMRLVTPGFGTIELSKEANPGLFYLARVGLGALGVITQLTLQCVPAHKLLEHTYVADVDHVQREHAHLLQRNKHLRYMWIPYTDDVVVVTNNDHKKGLWARMTGGSGIPPHQQHSRDEQLQELRQLLLEGRPDFDRGELERLSATQLRDQLLLVDPLNTAWVRRINQAEAAYWRKSEGYRVGWSDELLGFDCGGQQWVLETCFPTGPLRRPSGTDLAYVRDLLTLIEENALPAPAPIEQRWSAASRSLMSPAHSAQAPDPVHSWVGIIMYLPMEDPEQRKLVTESFRRYVKLAEEQVAERYGAVDHWAKIEAEELAPEDLERVQLRIAQHYPVARFNQARRQLDPKGILANDIINRLFPQDPLLIKTD